MECPHCQSSASTERPARTERGYQRFRGGVLDMEAMGPKLLILQNFRRRISTSGTPPVEERRRTKVIPHVWTEESLVHLVCGVLIRASDRWGRNVLVGLRNNTFAVSAHD